MYKIKQILPQQKEFELIARVEKVIISTANNGMNYMILHLADSTSRIEGRKWLLTEKDKQVIVPNSIILFKNLLANEYRGVLQLKIDNDYKVLNEVELENLGLKSADFFISAPIDIEKQYNNLIEIINNVENPVWKTLTLALIEKYKKQFLIYPAGMTIHHNVTGGLFWHSYTLVKNILAIKESYQYATINWDLVVCGAVLHDIGKVIELIDSSGTDYSLEGKVLGHISIGSTELNKIAEELNLYKNDNDAINKDLTLLQHMILSSHGKKEYGSPVEPVLIEALILSTFDDLDAKIYKINDELKKVKTGEWTQRILSIDGKTFYKHFDKNKK